MNFIFKPTELEGVLLIEPRVFGDRRGHFLEAFREEVFRKEGLIYRFVQDNISTSRKGAVRGLHYQKPPHAQAKLLMAINGRILDVAVDLRRNSPTYGKHICAELCAENRYMIYIPPGFAHGFSVLSDEATVFYKCSSYYHQPSERGVKWNDLALDIDWQVEEPIISDKDTGLPILRDLPEEDLF
ncbi:MAG: dTDP-4-dehydrorhamnose 3,5-epimerase [Balneolaceae bacterium]|nr:dTDP-4-dehydrorhamnose 3,5-epimerase [Balneolaceae bacterium]